MRFLLASFTALSLGWTLPVHGHSVFYEVTTGHPEMGYRHGFASPTTVAQVFHCTLPIVQLVDVTFTPPQTGSPELRVHEGSESGPVMAVSRNFVLNGGPYGRTRVVLSNDLPVVPGTSYYFELRMETPPGECSYDGSFGLVTWVPGPLGEYFLDGNRTLGAALEFGAGVSIPEILPAQGRTLSYLEGQGEMLLFPAAQFTNDYVTNFDGAFLQVASEAGGGLLEVNGLQSNALYVNGLPVGEMLNNSYSMLGIRFNSNATAAAVQSVLRQIVYWNDSDSPSVGPHMINLYFACPLGVIMESVSLQIMPVNDPPYTQPYAGAGIFPGSTNSVAIAPSRDGANVLLSSVSFDLDGNGPLLFTWTCEEQAGWSSHEFTPTNRFALGINHVTLRVSDGELMSEKTVVLEVITPGEGLRRLKRSVRSEARGRGRPALLRILVAAQFSLAQHHTRRFEQRLQHFQDAAREVMSNSSELNLIWEIFSDEIAWAVLDER